MNDDCLIIFNPIGCLQEIAMKQKFPLPNYSFVQKNYAGYTSFECTVQAMEFTATGTCTCTIEVSLFLSESD